MTFPVDAPPRHGGFWPTCLQPQDGKWYFLEALRKPVNILQAPEDTNPGSEESNPRGGLAFWDRPTGTPSLAPAWSHACGITRACRPHSPGRRPSATPARSPEIRGAS